MTHTIDLWKLRKTVEHEGVKGTLEALAQVCRMVAGDIELNHPGRQWDWIDAAIKIEEELVPYVLV